MNTFLFKLVMKILKFYLKPSKLEVIEGDLVELFIINEERNGTNRALLGLYWNVIRFFRWKYIKGFENIKYLGSMVMIKNYLKISVRSLLRHKFFSIINVAGLSIGIACCFMILMFIKHELTYDRFIQGHEKIMRLSLNGYGATPAPFAFTAKNEFPEIEQALRIYTNGEITFEFNELVFPQRGGLSVDSTFLDFFNWKLIEGNPKTALLDPQSIVLTKAMVLQFFNRKDIMGKFIKVDGVNRKVTGIAEDFPTNSHIGFNYLVPLPREKWVTNGYWTGNNMYTYFKLNSSANPKDLEQKFKLFVRKYMSSEILSYSGHSTYDDYLKDEGNSRYEFFLFPITDLHLKHKWMSITPETDIQQIYTFSIIALFILLIACVNFMNLSTARAGTRSREVGIRKVLGSLKGQLRNQFLIESIIISFISIFIAVILTALLLPYFNELSGKSFHTLAILSIENILILIGLGLFTGLISGLYPAFYLSAIKPLLALKGVFKTKDSSFLRKGLVSFQFAVSILLIICTIIVYAQVNYMTSKELGINTKHTLVINHANKIGAQIPVFKQRLLSLPEVNVISISSSYPSNWVPDWNYGTNEEIRKEISPDNIFVTPEYKEVLGLELLTGEFFQGHTNDSSYVIVNESFIRGLDWQLGESVGKIIKRGTDEKYIVKGVMKDFHSASFRSVIRPLLLRYTDNLEKGEDWQSYMLININGDYQKVIETVNDQWKQFAGKEAIRYSFLDQRFDRLYDNERKFGSIFTIFSVLAIIIACLGLFALSAFMIEQRIKEVAVRKVLGAKRFQIVKLFIISFFKLIVIGAFIAVPLAYYLADQWLTEYTTRLFLNPVYFVMPILLVGIITFATVATQVLRSGNMNPATILKNE